jgi:hypothetical protein
MPAHGQEMPGPNDGDLAAYSRKNGTNPGVKEQVSKLARRLQEARRVARENIRRGNRGQRTRHDQEAVRVSYHPGQLVYRKQMVRGRKLEPRWLGPYPVVQRISDLVYKIRIGSRETNVNIEPMGLYRATREELRSQRREWRRQRRERYSRVDRISESGDSNSDGCGDDPPFWPRSDDYSHQMPEAERFPDMNRSAPQSDAADNRAQLRAAESSQEPV